MPIAPPSWRRFLIMMAQERACSMASSDQPEEAETLEAEGSSPEVGGGMFMK
jgi:hypothetical protein